MKVFEPTLLDLPDTRHSDTSVSLDGLIDLAVIRENYDLIIQRYQPQYERMSTSYGLSVSDVQAEIQRNVEQAVDRSNFFRAIGFQTLLSILWQDGRFKSLFETGRSRGHNDTYDRAVAEHNFFGYDMEIDPAGRPIYGYFSDMPNGEVCQETGDALPSAVQYYGEIAVRIRREIALGRATLMFADQLDRNNRAVPSPAARPHFASFPIARDYEIRDIVTGKPDWGPRYTEVQYHGGLRMRDVDQIHMSTNNGSTRYEIECMQRGVGQYYEKTGIHIPVIEY